MSYSPIFNNGSISDSVFSIHSAIDITRKVVYDLSAIGPGITRTIVVPNFNVNFSDIYTHAARHLPSGADPIATGTPVDIGAANAPGVANSLVRSDHVHRGLRSIASNADPQRFGDIKLLNGSGVTVTDDGFGNYTIAATAAGTVTNIATGTGLTGGPITTTGTLSLASIAAATILSNITGAPAAPVANTLSAIIDNAASATQGSILYRNATTWVALAPGTSGQVLSSGGPAANPSWVAVAGTGTVTSVAMTVPGFLSVAGSPITSSGTLAVTLATQTANLVFAGPAAGGAVAPTFRSLVIADIPNAIAVTISSNANAIGTSGSVARADHTHQLTAVAALANQIPKYDGTNWQALYPEELLATANAFSFTEEFLTLQNTTIGGQLNNNAFMGINTWLQKSAGGASGVTMSTTRVDTNHPGVIDIIAGPTASAFCNVLLPGVIMVGGGILTYETLVWVSALSTVTNEYTIRIGLGDTTTIADNANGIYFEYTRTTNVNWLMKASKTSTVTSTSSGTAVTAAAWTKLKFVVNAAASSVEYFINGTSVGTVTTNIPTAVIIGLMLQQTRVAGTPAQYSVDYVNMYQRFTTAR